MAEKIIIDIELKGIGDAQKGLDDLTKLQITQQDAIKKTQQEIKDYEKSLKDLSNAQKEGKTLTETDIALQKVMTQNLEATKVSLAGQKDELSKTNTERRGAIKATENYNTALNAEMGSNEQLKAQLAILTAEYNKMSASERESTDAGKNLTTGIKGITDKLKENEKAVGDNKRNVGNYEGALTRLGSTLRNVAGAFGVFFGAAAIGKILKDSGKIVTNFETSLVDLSNVLGVTRSEMGLLKDQATELGATTAFSATEVLKLQEAYARLGFSQQQIIDLTPGTINGALALRASADETAELVGAVVNSFDDLSAVDSVKIIDQMTKATQSSALNFEKLNSALPTVAGAANAAGVPFDKLLSLLGKLSDAGIDASASGTALKNIFIAAAKDGKDYNAILDDIAGSSDKLSAAVDKTGKISAVSATILANNIKGVDELNKKVLDSAGAAAKVATESLDTAEGKIKLLGSAWEGFVLSIDEGDGVISSMIKGVLDFLTSGLTILTEDTRGIKNALILLAGSVALYNAQLILSTALTIKNTIVTKAKAAADLLIAGAMGAASLATAAYSFVITTLTSGVSLATAATIIFKATLDVLSGGLTFVITAIGLAVGAMLILINRTNELSATQKGLLDVQKEANKSYVKEKIEVDKLVKTLENESTKREDKLSAIEALNKIMPEGIEKITEEDIATGALTTKIELLNEAKVKQYKIAALANKQIEVEEKLIDAEAATIQENIKWYDYLGAISFTLSGSMEGLAKATQKGTLRREEAIKSLESEAKAYAEEENSIISELDALLGLNEGKKEEIELIDIKKNASKDAEKASDAAVEKEKQRIASLEELIRTEKENLEFKKDKLLEELKLSEDGKELTKLEFDAKKNIIDQYNKDVADLNEKATKESQELALAAVEDDIKASNEASGKDLNILELTYLQKMRLAKGNIEEQKALTAQYDADKLAEMQRAIEAEMQLINNEIDNLSASVTFPDLSSALLSEQALDDLKARLVEAGIALEQLGLSVDDVVTPKDGARSIGDSLGMSEEQVEIAKATYSSAMDAISATLDIANQVMQQKTTERIDAIQSSLESGVINEEQAEQQTQAVRKEAFEKNKKMQQAQAAISFASGLVAMWANAMTLPFPVNFIVGGSQSAILTATYLAQSASIKKQKFAEGGHVRGAGSGTSDSIDAKLSHGEFVQKTKAVDYYGVPFMKALNNMQIPRMFAEGGLVTPMPLSNQSSQIAQSLSESITNVQRQDLRVINVEQDFSKMQNRVNNVERARTY